MPSYFDRFGPIPQFSSHAWGRLHERGIAMEDLHSALAMNSKLGTSRQTVPYTDGYVTAVVNAATGVIVTLWVG